MSKPELKPCPFCGCNERYVAHIPRKRSVFSKEDYKTVYQVICTKCGAKTGSKRTEKEAEEAWNRRVEDEQSSIGTGYDGELQQVPVLI